MRAKLKIADENCDVNVMWIDPRTHHKMAWCRVHHEYANTCLVCGDLYHTRRPNGSKTCGDKCRQKRSRSKV